MEFQTKRGEWYQTIIYEPDIWDDDSEVKCILKQGNEEMKASLILDIFMFEDISEDAKETRNFADGEEMAEFSVTFKIYPSPDSEKVWILYAFQFSHSHVDFQIKWVITDESKDEPTEIKLGKRTDKYEATSLKSDGSQTYTVHLHMKNVKHDEDGDKIITLEVEVQIKTISLLIFVLYVSSFQLENGETRVIQLPFAVSPPVIPTTAKPTAPPIIENLDGTIFKATKHTNSKSDFFP